MKKERRMRITPNGQVREQLTMFEVIEEAEKLWKPLYEEGKINLGEAVVLFPSMEFNEITYVVANVMPQPIMMKLDKGWKKGYVEIVNFLKEQGLYVIESDKSTYRKVDEETQKLVIKEAKKKMRMNRF